jgi:hypothetical protein
MTAEKSNTDYIPIVTPPRNVDLIACAAYVELDFLRRHGIDIGEVPSLLAILNTKRIAKEGSGRICL